MTTGTEHFLGNREHLGVNGLALGPGRLYSMPQTSVNSGKTERKKRIFNLSVHLGAVLTRELKIFWTY